MITHPVEESHASQTFAHKHSKYSAGLNAFNATKRVGPEY